jgi:hypothetical protein
MDPISTIASTAISVALRMNDGSFEATGTYQYSPQISQVEACKRAEEKAKLAIIHKAVGHEFTSDKISSCSESTNDHSCKFYDTSYESSKGYIKSMIDRQETVKDWTCSVKVKATVGKTDYVVNPEFDLAIEFPNTLFKTTDTLSFTLTPNAQGYLYVYVYTPSENTVKRIFPGQYQRPFVMNNKQIKINATEYPLKLASTKDSEERYVFAFISGMFLSPLDQYQLQSFYEMWDNIRARKRMVKRGFVITR